MTTLVLQSWKSAQSAAKTVRIPWRPAVLALVVALALSDTPAGEAARTALSDAYLSVATFVAGTLFLVHWMERGLGIDLGELMTRRRAWAVPIAALLGAFPGCGGAIIVTTQFTLGRSSLGALVATLTATMGDAAFLLLAREPTTALLVIGLGLLSGTAMGYLVDTLHPDLSARTSPLPGSRTGSPSAQPQAPISESGSRPSWTLWTERIWLALLVPGGVFSVLLAFQINPDSFMGPLSNLSVTKSLGVTGSLVILAMWSLKSVRGGPAVVPGPASSPSQSPCRSATASVMADTNFVSVWVIGGFMAYEMTVTLTGVDLAAWFETAAPVMPLVGVAVGLLPGCGPQIIVTALYLNGLVPFSALLGNALSNDGDALFPAIALAPRSAALATAYSAAPAVAMAYGAYALGY
ncbi:putative manganese transporter [Rhodospirillum sp. A1_3_36]|uniref:putative manganese transporter n=1 Tax=Rhodospirillum sp. A1_3_36 TaxID=3391666 RepID=UPI0039A4C5D1